MAEQALVLEICPRFKLDHMGRERVDMRLPQRFSFRLVVPLLREFPRPRRFGLSWCGSDLSQRPLQPLHQRADLNQRARQDD
jgi:hypothetical protein